MFKSFLKFFSLIFSLVVFTINFSAAEIIKKIEVSGNERISRETINIFINVSINEDLNTNELNSLLKELYDTGFFKDVKIKIEDNILQISVVENPIIQTITYTGIKAEKIREPVLKNLKLRQRSSYNKILLKKDKEKIISMLRDYGYYFSTVDVFVEELEDNKVNISFDIELGNKAKIKKISFIGDKVLKDRKLRRIILSEEYKFWKFLSGKKFLNESLINFDSRLLNNYYLNKGYYNVEINSSFAKLIEDQDFELIYNINAGNKVFFQNLELEIPIDYNKDNFTRLNVLLKNFEGELYSINSIEEILEEIDLITLSEQYESVKAEVVETLNDDKLDLKFIIKETEKFYVERINILGNNITRESVIRNQFEVDEGDPYNEILKNKSINNIKSLNFFKNVNSTVRNSEKDGFKIIDISVEEKPTGEIGASAGVGTSGNSIGFSVRENNFLGRGIGLNTNLTLSTDTLKGIFSVKNPNFKNTDKSIYASLEALETDKLKNYGYKTSKTGFSFGTSFEYFDDFILGLGMSNFYEKIETDSTASVRQKSQEGDYWDTFLKFDFDLDKRNQKFQTSQGYRSFYSLDVPIVSETNSLKNVYNYKYFTELYDQNISTISLYLSSVNSLSNDDVKLSERLNIPASKLRGFESGRVGPKDGTDFIGGNYVTTLNFSSTLPQLLENSQNTDFVVFFDAANIWGVDYNSSVDSSNKIRSAIGVGVDWFTPIGPLNFSLSQTLSKADSDKTELFRFNLGTTF